MIKVYIEDVVENEERIESEVQIEAHGNLIVIAEQLASILHKFLETDPRVLNAALDILIDKIGD